MATTTLAGFFGMFSDQVYSAKDLNRRAGAVLDHARKSPVTISRNGEQFALFKREQAACLVQAVSGSGRTLELVGGVLTAIEGGVMPPALEWLKVFSRDELRQMTREILTAASCALNETGNWEAVEAVIHEWHESAMVAMSGVFEETMGSPREETALTDPRIILEAEKELAAPIKR